MWEQVCVFLLPFPSSVHKLSVVLADLIWTMDLRFHAAEALPTSPPWSQVTFLESLNSSLILIGSMLWTESVAHLHSRAQLWPRLPSGGRAVSGLPLAQACCSIWPALRIAQRMPSLPRLGSWRWIKACWIVSYSTWPPGKKARESCILHWLLASLYWTRLRNIWEKWNSRVISRGLALDWWARGLALT